MSLEVTWAKRPRSAARGRSRRVLRSVAGLVAAACLGAPAVGQTTFNETEPNDQKAAANGPFVMTAGDMIAGFSTGSSTSNPGDASADYFMIQMAPLPAGIYQHRLVITTDGTAGHVGSLRGLTQSSGVPNPGTDAQLMASLSTTTPPRYVQWYGFGQGETVYFRVAGTSSTTGTYTATLETVPVTATDLGTYYNGNITIDRPAGVTTDIDFWVYDSNLNAIPDYGNDTPNTLTRNYAAGTYYIAYTNFNFANEMPAASDEGFLSGSVWDFPGAASCSSGTLLPSLAVQLTDTFTQAATPTPKNSQFDVVWLTFTVSDTPPPTGACCLPDGTCVSATSAGCAGLEGTYSGDGSDCGTVACPQPGACCLPAFQCSILSSGQCGAAGGTYMGDGSVCGSCPPPPPGTFVELEPNDSKEGANGAFQMAAGNVIIGTTTGSSTTNPGLVSADYFVVKTMPAAPGIYQHRLIVTTDGTAGHTLTIRGLSQSGGVINFASDATIQTSSTATSPPRYIQWYGFGREEQVYVRVTGTSSTTSPYTLTLETTPVAPIELGEYYNGDITIARPAGVSTDTDFWVYDSNLNAIPNYGNDDPGTMTRNFGIGTYYVAYTNYNLANEQAAAFDDTFLAGAVLDFAAAANSSTTLFPNLTVGITDAFDTVVTPTPKNSQFDIQWLRFTVGGQPPVTGACCLPDGTCVQATFNGCGALGGQYAGDNVACEAANCPAGACCLPDGSCIISGPGGCAALEGLYQGDGTDCGSVNCPQPGACCMPDFTCSVLSESQCATNGGLYQGNGTVCGACPAPPPGSVAILAADSALNVADVVQKLAATDLFPFIGTPNVTTATPTLQDLQQFDAVMVFSNTNFQNNEALGNVLADYVDAGGGVVVNMFTLSTISANRFLAGRWDATYQIVPQMSGNFTGAGATLGLVHDPAHDIMQGVASLAGGTSGYRPTTTDLTAHGVKIAEWSDGKTLVAVSNTLPNRADIGLFPPSSDRGAANWDATTDGARLMANALLYVAGGSCIVDWNDDGNVNSSDISAFLAAWLASVQGQTLDADFNGDNAVNSTDISAFLAAWLNAIQNGC